MPDLYFMVTSINIALPQLLQIAEMDRKNNISLGQWLCITPALSSLLS
jgi:hypothetical protein